MQKTSYCRPKPRGASDNEIAEFAGKMRLGLGLKTPVNLDRAVALLGGETTRSPKTPVKPPFSYIRVEKGGGFQIGLSPSLLGGLLYRLEVAQCLGHYFLHSDAGKMSITTNYRAPYGSEKQRVIDWEAHLFACEFMMPSRILRRCEKRFRGSTVWLAGHFQMPEPIVRLALERMQNKAL